jgi:signal peptidase II
MSMARRVLVFVLTLAGSVVVDQATKVVANDTLKGQPAREYLGDLFRLQWATNEGAFLSLGANLPPTARYWVLTIGVGVLLLGITIYTMRTPKLDAWQVAGYALIVGGGGSNWFDRARFDGRVVDFMNMGIGAWPRTGIFNVADLWILVGIGVLMIHGWIQEKKAKAAAAATTAKPA